MRKPGIFTVISMLSVFCIIVLLAGCAGTKPSVVEDAEYDVIIIGAGLGGLSAGTHLAMNNLKVLVLEQHTKVGGCATNFTRGDFTFDSSLHEMAGGAAGKNDRGLYRLLNVTGVDKKA